MIRQSPRHILALLASVIALSFLAVPALTWTPQSSRSEHQRDAVPVAERDAPHSLPVTAVLKATKTDYVVGETPQIQVGLKNESDDPVVLVGSLDASDIRWRYPYCYLEIKGPPDAQQWGLGRCGNTNPLRREDFVTVQPGEVFDPYQTVDDYGFFSCSQLDWHNFAVAGTYRLTWVYSTNSQTPQEWVGDGTLDEVSELLSQVPRGEARSNSIEVTFAPPPEGYVPTTLIPRDHPEAAHRGTWFLFKLLTTGPLNFRLTHERYIWLFDGDGLASEQHVEEFRQLYENLAYEIAPFKRVGQEVSRQTTVAVINPDLEIRGDAHVDKFEEATKLLGGSVVDNAGRQRNAVLDSMRVVTDERCQEEAIVLFVFTEEEFDSDDMPEYILPGETPQKLAIVRVTRRNESWIPEVVRMR